MPSPARTAARPCWRRWSEGTCSWSRSTTAAAGIAITTSSPTCCARACWTSSPTRSPELHRRASEWYERNGEPSEAIRHALAAEDFERAADLVELAIPAMRQESTGGHAARLARGAARRRLSASGPCSASAYAGALLVHRRARGRRSPAAGRRTVAGHGEGIGGTDAIDGDGRRRRRGSSAVCRVDRRLPCRHWPWSLGDVAGTVDHARRALDLVARRRPCRARSRGGAPGSRRLGERGARGSAPVVRRLPWRVCSGPGTSPTSSAAPSPWRTSGSRRVDSARRCAHTSRRCSCAAEQGAPVLRGTADMHVGMSELHRERNDLACRHASTC